MSPEFSITVRGFPGFEIVALREELDIVSAAGLADALVEVAGSTLVVDLWDLTFTDSGGTSAVVVPGKASCVDRGMVAGLG